MTPKFKKDIAKALNIKYDKDDKVFFRNICIKNSFLTKKGNLVLDLKETSVLLRGLTYYQLTTSNFSDDFDSDYGCDYTHLVYMYRKICSKIYANIYDCSLNVELNGFELAWLIYILVCMEIDSDMLEEGDEESIDDYNYFYMLPNKEECEKSIKQVHSIMDKIDCILKNSNGNTVDFKSSIDRMAMLNENEDEDYCNKNKHNYEDFCDKLTSYIESFH